MLARKLRWPKLLAPLLRNTPLAQGVLMFGIDAGVLIFSWYGLERVPWRQYFASNVYGDTLGLPAIAFGEVALLRCLPDGELRKWHTSRTWYGCLMVALVVLWWSFTVGVEYRSGDVNLQQYVSPSKAWHTVVWPLLAFMLLAPAPAALSMRRRRPQALAVALAGLTIWGASSYYDFVVRETQPLGGIVEFSWSQWWRNLRSGQPFTGPSPSRLRVDLWMKTHGHLPPGFSSHYYTDGRIK